jgi:hypothetical protein
MTAHSSSLALSIAFIRSFMRWLKFWAPPPGLAATDAAGVAEAAGAAEGAGVLASGLAAGEGEASSAKPQGSWRNNAVEQTAMSVVLIFINVGFGWFYAWNNSLIKPCHC